MAEFSANQLQTVNPGETVIFTESPVPCRRGLIRHRDDTGNFLLVGYIPRQYGCRCQRQQDANYLVDFGANIAIPPLQLFPLPYLLTVLLFPPAI